MEVPEPLRLSEVVPQVPHIEEWSRSPARSPRRGRPRAVEHVAHAPHDIVLVPLVIDEDAVPVDAERIAFGCLCQWKTIWILEAFPVNS